MNLKKWRELRAKKARPALEVCCDHWQVIVPLYRSKSALTEDLVYAWGLTHNFDMMLDYYRLKGHILFSVNTASVPRKTFYKAIKTIIPEARVLFTEKGTRSVGRVKCTLKAWREIYAKISEFSQKSEMGVLLENTPLEKKSNKSTKWSSSEYHLYGIIIDNNKYTIIYNSLTKQLEFKLYNLKGRKYFIGILKELTPILSNPKTYKYLDRSGLQINIALSFTQFNELLIILTNHINLNNALSGMKTIFSITKIDSLRPFLLKKMVKTTPLHNVSINKKRVNVS